MSSDANNLQLDFDDIYQWKLAQEYALDIVTMDKDFKKVSEKVLFV